MITQFVQLKRYETDPYLMIDSLSIYVFFDIEIVFDLIDLQNWQNNVKFANHYKSSKSTKN